jgi:serine/threonine protein kinase
MPRPVASSSKYHVLMELGKGGMAVVHAAMARGMGGFSKLVVLKKAREEFGDRPEAVRMFLNEARLSARMNHPNVVQVYEVYEEQGLPVIVMEYLAGQPFATVLRRAFNDPSYSLNLALSVLCRSLEGLHYAHTLTDFSGRPLKLIHRDVTPHNIMVTYDGQVKLLDFGIAKLDAGAAETKTGVIKGKLGYMPREQVDGSELDIRADVFAIGVMIWEAAARQRMWGTLSDATVIKHLLCDEIPPLRAVNPDVEPELEVICNKATAPNRDNRYADANELLVALQAYLRKRGGVASESAIAEWVNRSCADLKAESQKRMDRELATFTEGGDGRWAKPKAEVTASRPQSSGPNPEATRSASLRRPQADTGTGEGYAGHTQTETAMVRSRRWAVMAGAAAVAVGLLIAWQGAMSPPSVDAPAAASAALDPVPVPAEKAEAATVKVSLRAEPVGAQLYLDGKRLAANPFIGALPSDQRDHELRAEAQGFTTATRTLRLDADVDVMVALTATPGEVKESPADEDSNGDEAADRGRRQTRKTTRAKAQSPKPAAAKPEPVSTPEPVVAAPSNQCDPPFIVVSGIKRYKRGCFGK